MNSNNEGEKTCAVADCFICKKHKRVNEITLAYKSVAIYIVADEIYNENLLLEIRQQLEDKFRRELNKEELITLQIFLR